MDSAPSWEAQVIWRAAWGALELQMPRENFDTWLRPVQLVAHQGSLFTLGAPNTYVRDWLEHRLKLVVQQALAQAAGAPAEVCFVLMPQAEPDPANLKGAGPLWAAAEGDEFDQLSQVVEAAGSGLNPRHSFDAYVVGACNRLAQAAAQAVAEAPAAQFNPLFVYGSVGMGKTHLLHAIGNQCMAHGAHVRFTSAEAFTNDLVTAIKARKVDAFRDKYRRVDVLLVDDVQFFNGKAASQEEFLHTFEELFNAGAHIVLAAAHPPALIKGLDARLHSRFEGGLMVELQPPDDATRLDMLDLKARLAGQDDLPPPMLERAAAEAGPSFRDLEGALNRVLAHALLGQAVPPAAAQVVESVHKTLDAQAIIAEVAAYYDVPVADLYGRDRSREVSVARQVAMYILYKKASLSLPQIGELLGGRSHSTVLYSCERIAELVKADTLTRRHISEILQHLQQPLPLPQPLG